VIESNPTISPSVHQESKPGLADEKDVGENSFNNDDVNSLPNIRITQRVYRNGDGDETSAFEGDDIYNFDLSDEQKQLSQDLYDNLKLDLGFIAG